MFKPTAVKSRVLYMESFLNLNGVNCGLLKIDLMSCFESTCAHYLVIIDLQGLLRAVGDLHETLV